MALRNVSKIVLCCLGLALLTSCGNTIRGVGKDTASAVNATQDAGRNVEKAAKY